MTDDILIRLSLAREGLAILPAEETRARNALDVLDRYIRGDATHRELVHAGAACRSAFRDYARQGRHSACLALFAAYDVVDRVARDPELAPAPRPSIVLRLYRLLAAWLRQPRALPPYPGTPYRTATTLDTLDGKARP